MCVPYVRALCAPLFLRFFRINPSHYCAFYISRSGLSSHGQQQRTCGRNPHSINRFIGGNMKKLLMAMMMAMVTVTVGMSGAEAKRMGGGMASMISTILMVGLLAFAAMFIYRMLRRKQDGAVAKPAFAGPAASYTPEIGSRIEPRNEPRQPAALQSAQPAASSHVMPQTPWGVPSDFDTTGFLRHAKTYFIRLQAAWDKADVGDIREFTTPQMFAELKMQIQERGASPNMTNEKTQKTQLLGMETHADEYLASVQFSGTIRESEHGAAEPFTEVWNLSKPISSHGGWVLAGIQQLS